MAGSPSRAKRVLKRLAIALFVIVAVLIGLGLYVRSIIFRRHCDNHAALGPEHANAAVATANRLATDAAAHVLEQGGNAVDAAIAAALMLAVADPFNSGLGGGGFSLVYDPKTTQSTFLDFRENAPAGLDPAKLRAALAKDASALRNGPLAVAVPAEWSGLVELHRRYGSWPLRRLAAPAIAAAHNGVVVSALYTLRCVARMGVLRSDPEARRIYLGAAGLCPLSGWTLHEPELAHTLEALTDPVKPVSWSDLVARPMVADLSRRGAMMIDEDAKEPAVKERPTVSGSFEGYRIVSIGPPSSGGIILISWLQAYERMRHRLPSADWLHLWIEASRESFFDRAMLMGDPDFVDVPVGKLTSPEYADAQAARVQPSGPLSLPAAGSGAESQHTTQVSVVDGRGMAVAMTISVNLAFGSGVVVPGTGVLLNDTMDDFFAGGANAFGLVGNDKNAPLPRKRPLSSMTPTIVLDDKGPYAVLGSRGGSHIPTTVATVLRGLIDEHRSPGDAVHAERIHHQWRPDHAEVERGFLPELPADVRANATHPMLPIGEVQLVVRTEHGWRGASDCRGEGHGWAGAVAVPP